MKQTIDIAVIGAGLTGLTTAHYLKKAGKNFRVIERKKVVGGDIQTGHENGFAFEQGPSTGVMSNEFVAELFEDLQGLCELERPTDAVNKRYVLYKGKWEALPSGLMGGVKTPLFTWKDKLSLLGEPFRKPGTNPNETLSELVLRRMGKSFLDYAIDPFIIGVYAGDPGYLVPRFALPKLYNLEQNYGSFIGGSVKMMREKARIEPKTDKKKKEKNRIFSVKGGLSNFMQALYQSAGTENFLLGVAGLTIVPENGIYHITGKNADGSIFELTANKVITTTGAYELDKLLPFVDETKMQNITNLRYARVLQIALGFNQWMGWQPDAFGGLISHKENRQILGVLFPSVFLQGRAPEKGALFSVFMGGVRNNNLVEKSDDEIRSLLEKEICDLMKLQEFKPDLIRIFRYNHAIPQYGADCEARFAALDQIQSEYSGLYIGGNLRNGIGMADRIKQGKELAGMV
ncbi:protoporphyrinogen oxidase [Parabacteroides sp. FAFU027]|uniref:protoporphyrinogen oxidase n=1 Tax=Parabacteroides sp. FAFU027 TaxID=2922715 RepID=UPI001FAF92AB|nr:protoporphyrinogen oxidase [Parabacteroides sp. FAFU027]